jgi:RNA polymerase sigma-70 factor, ECF subfamily
MVVERASETDASRRLRDVSEQAHAGEGLKEAFMAFYDTALPHVWSYLSPRCPTRATAEELTSEVFLAAVDAVRKNNAALISVPWVIGVARHKLVDYWRAEAREQRRVEAVAGDVAFGAARAEDPWDARVDEMRARDVLQRIAPQHRAALCLRYLDGLPVAEVADELGRSLHATEALLMRAKAAFRREYDNPDNRDG